MIKSFRNKGIEAFFKNGSKAGIQGNHAAKLARQLIALDEAGLPGDMNIPGWRLHSLAGDMAHHWSIRVSANWRLTFAFENGDAVLVDYKDYALREITNGYYVQPATPRLYTERRCTAS